MTDQPTDDLRGRLQGLWLPLITPFRDGGIDQHSLRRLVLHYAARPIDGLILAATSGMVMMSFFLLTRVLTSTCGSGIITPASSESGFPSRRMTASSCRAESMPSPVVL